MKQKIIRITTVPGSLLGLLKGQLNFMSTHFNILGISSNGNGLLKEMGNLEGIKTIPVEMTRKITPFKDIVAVIKLYKIFKKEKPDVVHTHTPKAGTVGMIAAKIARVPNRLHTIAGLPLVEANGHKRILLNLVEKITYSCATKIYPNSYGLKNIILKHNFTKEEKIKVLGNGSSNGIDTNYFNPALFSNSDEDILKEKLKIKSSDFIFIFIGRLVTDKGINELIRAFKKLNDTNSNIKLLLVGPYEHDMDPLLPETIHAINNNENIISAGWQNDVRPFLSISNVLVFPSYREGFPNVVMQAASMNLPCIVTNINGCNEIIKDNINGTIIPVKKYKRLLEAMSTYLKKDKKELNAMGNKSREFIINNFDQNYVWNSILNEYNSILKC